MKKLAVVALTCVVSFMSSCNDEVGLETEEIVKNTIMPASGEVKSIYSNWLNSQSLNGRSLSPYSVENTYEIYHGQSGKKIQTVINQNDPSKSLSFVIDQSGSISRAFLSQSSKRVDGSVEGKITSLQGELWVSFIDYPTGRRQITSYQPNGRINSWWSDFDDCFGAFNELTDSNFANWVIDGVLNAATAGLYTPMSIVVCAGVASAG